MPSPAPSETPAVSLRAMELDDVPTVVRLHRANLPSGFFVELGDRFLGRYYRSFLTSPAAVALVAESGGAAAGFLVGSTDEAAHHRHLMRFSRWDLARAGLASLLVRPELTARFMRTRARRYLRGMRRSPGPGPAGSGRNADGGGGTGGGEGTGGAPLRTGVLSHIAVDSGVRRSGVGAVLVGGFTGIARVHGVERLRLYTGHDNQAAQRFYRRLGWEEQPVQHDIDGVPWTPFVLDL
ncbi:GNAT family N-acetyltransferase [Nocardiopsis sp. RSe5-2]|uniref:GNAT family N-acetyltransferase n=1 Tax=Nocardiopsis endophytica TaxID=3018445 RepID=A0ABT4UAM3_9ACTN|nr:GNAT family N-acetyltransferase [Nocardiopsis endophytica]MDA2813440.1 GNAT family N-acetyltransferase [Nocardiopsis endophytica]